MSVTFYVPSAPRTRKLVPCSYGKGESWECRAEERCGYCEDGQEEVVESPAPEVNVAGATAEVLLGILGIPYEPIGTLAAGHIPGVRRRIVRALSTSLCEREATPGTCSGGPGTGKARLISAGISAERLRDRLARLDAVLSYAQANGQDVGWS